LKRLYRCIRFVWYTSGCFPTPSFHIRTERSHPPLTNSAPVGLQSQLITAATCPLYICVGDDRDRTSNVYRLWSSEANRIDVGNVGDHARELLLICMTTLRSAFPVRISYNVKVRSEPMLARTLDSDKLNRTQVIVSVEVGNVIFDIGELFA